MTAFSQSLEGKHGPRAQGASLRETGQSHPKSPSLASLRCCRVKLLHEHDVRERVGEVFTTSRAISGDWGTEGKLPALSGSGRGRRRDEPHHI